MSPKDRVRFGLPENGIGNVDDFEAIYRSITEFKTFSNGRAPGQSPHVFGEEMIMYKNAGSTRVPRQSGPDDIYQGMFDMSPAARQPLQTSTRQKMAGLRRSSHPYERRPSFVTRPEKMPGIMTTSDNYSSRGSVTSQERNVAQDYVPSAPTSNAASTPGPQQVETTPLNDDEDRKPTFQGFVISAHYSDDEDSEVDEDGDEQDLDTFFDMNRASNEASKESSAQCSPQP